ncbi:squalene/phytoene synthase family protein [Sphingosinicella sp. CPCC 101087]|uniref:squalene/phytoene synthase family protein n=1 Tax=Sphingosinicella sp. CPCC 101087 TaxID=2497754 RepID=UPI00101DD9DD|nr:squalene/phytoene synthase family protein [Sphingosinicella sp. CPCC 101087]
MIPDLDPEVQLSLAYIPAPRRPALGALWRLDAALAAVLATGREPMISRIRLAWWRESLEKLDHERPPGEPVLEAVARDILPAGVRGAELAGMEAGWAVLTEPGALSAQDLDTYARGRGAQLFALAARLLGLADPAVVEGGEAWALVDLARRSSNPEEAAAALAAARGRSGLDRWPVPLRPLGMLARLALDDAERGALEAQGSPRRVIRMLRHRLTGR